MDVRQGTGGCEVLAPAKLNLLLEVLARRQDGFHEIETLMVPIALYDTISLRSVNPPDSAETPAVRLECRWAVGLRSAEWEDLPQANENIVVLALEHFRRRAGVSFGCHVRLVKRIPSAAGLGGGSSDAAAAIAAANRAWNINWSMEKLQALAAEIGSDVPFFLGSGAAICRGRGEQIELVSEVPAMNLVVVAPASGLSTADVYRRCQPADAPKCARPLIDALRVGNWNEIGARMHNQLEAVAESMCPAVGRAKRDLADCGCPIVRMSGSGSSCFGICRSSRQARIVARRMQGRGWSRTVAVRSVR